MRVNSHQIELVNQCLDRAKATWHPADKITFYDGERDVVMVAELKFDPLTLTRDWVVKAICAVAVVSTIACTPKKAPEPVVVKIPVPVECPKVAMPPRPDFPVIQDGDDVATMAKKLAVGNALLVQYIRQLEVLLAPFSTPGASNVPAGLPPQPGQRQAANVSGRSGENPVHPGGTQGVH